MRIATLTDKGDATPADMEVIQRVSIVFILEEVVLTMSYIVRNVCLDTRCHM